MKIAQASAVLRTVLWRATAPKRIGYFMNNIRRQHMANPAHRAQLSSGTSAVESVNKEINKWFANYNDMFE